MSTQIIPSLLVNTQTEFEKQITAVQDHIDMIQLDIADGTFVPNTTWGDPEVVKDIVEIDTELHLMVEDPLEEIKNWTDIDQINRVLFHYESKANIAEVIDFIHAQGWEAGLVLNPKTKIQVVEEYLKNLDDVMFMGVTPGFQGQSMISEVLDKIKKFKSKHPDCFTEIDGSVNEDTLSDIISTGVDAVCPGSAIFGNDRTPKENIKSMQKLIKKLS